MTGPDPKLAEAMALLEALIARIGTDDERHGGLLQTDTIRQANEARLALWRLRQGGEEGQ